MSQAQSTGVAAFTTPALAVPIRTAGALQWAILLLLIAQLGRIPFLPTRNGSAPLLVNELVLVGLFVTGAVACVSARSLRLDNVLLTALVFGSLGAFSTFLAYFRLGMTGLELLLSLAYLFRWLFYLGVYLFIINCIAERDVAGVWVTMENMLLLFAAFGIVQSIFLPNFAQMVYPDAKLFIDFDPQGHRLVSTMLEPNVAGLILTTGILVQLSLMSMGEPVATWKPALLFLALVMTVSRSAFLAIIIGGITIVAIRGLTKRILRIAMAVLAVLIALSPRIIEAARMYDKLDFSSGSSAAMRYLEWVRMLGMFIEHPILGIGFNTYAAVLDRTSIIEVAGAGRASSEGGIMFVATMTGVIGAAIFCVMLGFVIRRCRFVWRHGAATPLHRGLAMGTTSSIVALCVHSLFVNSMFATFVMEMFWVLCGLVFVIAHDLAGASAVAPVPAAAVSMYRANAPSLGWAAARRLT